MKKYNNLMNKACFVVALIGLINVANATNRMDRISWTDRGLSNPPLAQQRSSLDNTIEQFWNIKLADEPVRSFAPRATVSTPSCSVPRSSHSMEVKQDRNTRERRGYFGINLFNAIPIIDFVHGSVTTDSSDNVKGRR
jgi:hypothetical protein